MNNSESEFKATCQVSRLPLSTMSNGFPVSSSMYTRFSIRVMSRLICKEMLLKIGEQIFTSFLRNSVSMKTMMACRIGCPLSNLILRALRKQERRTENKSLEFSSQSGSSSVSKSSNSWTNSERENMTSPSSSSSMLAYTARITKSSRKAILCDECRPWTMKLQILVKLKTILEKWKKWQN